MVPRENKNNAYAKCGRINKEYYGIFQSGLYSKPSRDQSCFDGSVGTYSLPGRVARVRDAMVLVVSYGILIERVIYYPWGMHICDYDAK